ncbi:MAG: hypothetical protein EOO67_20650 [Microbacterium sp.]|nr:MAG: hypothetical protein EOO67_20650 [Microbacterium sp.]
MNRSPLKLAAALATAAVLLLPLAGCGGDDDDKPGSTASTTLDPDRAAFAEDVAPFCAEARAGIAAISSAYPAGTVPTDEQFATSLKQASMLILLEVDQIRKVKPPESLADRVDGWLAELEKAANRMPKLTKADAKKGIDVFSASDPYARDLGLNACTSSGE